MPRGGYEVGRDGFSHLEEVHKHHPVPVPHWRGSGGTQSRVRRLWLEWLLADIPMRPRAVQELWCRPGRVQGRWQSRAAGFTLLEVLVAVFIVAVALVTFMGLHLRSLDATIRAQDLTTAVLLAQGRLATMPEFPEPGEEQGKFEGSELERFQWETAVAEQTLDAIGSGQAVTVRHLTVTVLWGDGQQTRHYTLEAYRVQ